MVHGRVADLYICFLLDLPETLNSVGYPLGIVFAPPEKKRDMARLLGEGYNYRPQVGSDLGELMKKAFLDCFAEGMEAVVLIWSDLPDLPGPRIIQRICTCYSRLFTKTRRSDVYQRKGRRFKLRTLQFFGT